MNTAHGYVILGGGSKLVTNLKETKEAKCKDKNRLAHHTHKEKWKW